MTKFDVFDEWSDIVPGLRASLAAYKHRHTLQNWYKRLIVSVGKGDTNVVVLGRPSTGKSVFTAMLHGEGTDLGWNVPDVSFEVESRAIRLGDWTKIVRVLPGQTSQERDTGLHEAFSKHKNLEGIVYLVDWGFTMVRDNTVTAKMVSEDGIKTISDLRKFNLEQELDDFRQICSRIKEAHSRGAGPKWLLIVVNKVDLYYNEIDQAREYYHPDMKSAFSQVLQDLVSHIGRNNFRCAAVPVCAWVTDFIWNEESIVGRGTTESQRVLFLNLNQVVARLEKN